MPLLKHKHAYKSDVGPSIIVKRIQDDDTFVDFREYNGYEQWTKKANKHRTDAIYRPDPLSIDGYAVPYSLDKKRRWVLPEMIEERIEDLQDPSLNLRVSASIHRCSRGDSFPPSVLKAQGPEQYLTIAYRNVTRTGEVQHKRSRRAQLSTLECEQRPSGNRLNPNRAIPEKCLPKEENMMFQKVHVRYTIMMMTEKVGRVSKYNRTFRPSLIHRRPKVLPEDLTNLLDLAVDEEEPAFFGFNDDQESEGPSTRTLGDFIAVKGEKKRRTFKKAKKPYRDEQMPSRASFLPTTTESSDDDYVVLPHPFKLSLNEQFLSASGEARMCSVCCESRQAFTIGCGHSSCSSCWLRHMETAVGVGSYLPCMIHNCTHSMTALELKSLLSTESFVLVQRSLTDALVAKGEARYCPQCHRGVKYSNSQLDMCECGARLCGHCPSLFHSPLICRDAKLYQQYLTKNGIESLYEIIPSVTRITDLVRCPGCEVPMQRERGCPSMTCLCGVQFCYNCGRERDGPHNSNTCRRQRFETIILMDVFQRSEYSTFHLKNLREAARSRAELNVRKREINEMLKCLSTSSKRQILRALSSIRIFLHYFSFSYQSLKANSHA
ncbi:hypothetical protein PRIPAC_76211 [Pristionchus pacificus]|uniref:RBR-type E3 ubiquitin transferase n=1 Tax=Pristionchus pacificus TaxID=54126 RepID=A0A2A6C639_PRIPA|nr:hypothetical protein PRIPAC_76211 [Pristionchus pacificus]|eukprot:PDM73600.1 hypothetical protein PRIPAC_40956 [Pristionchus pacificus]